MIRKLSGFVMLAVVLASFACRDQLKVESVKPRVLVSGEPHLLDIQGRGFKPGAKVMVASEECPEVVVASSRRIVALAPLKMNAGTADLKVENPDGESALLISAFQVKRNISITRVSPGFAPPDVKNIQVRVEGAEFMKGAKVYFGDTPAKNVTYLDENTLDALVPALGPGLYDVKVVNPDGSSALLPDSFQVRADSGEPRFVEMREEAGKYGLEGSPKGLDQGLAFADLDRDGNPEILVVGNRRTFLFRLAGENRFEEVAEPMGLSFKSIAYCGSFGDFDNDGFPDLFIAGQPAYLFHNRKGQGFDDVTETAGLPKDLHARSAVWLDYNRDGLLDLFVGTLAEDDHLYHNRGGRFEEVFPELFQKLDLAIKNENRQPTTFSAAAADFDRDGFVDLFVGIRGLPSRLFRNRGGKGFEEKASALGLSSALPSSGKISLFKPNWGVAWADFDNDGYFDLLSLSGPVGGDLYRNRAGKEFVNVTRAMRIMFYQDPLSPDFGDFDNDGRLDFALSDNLSGVHVYWNRGDGSFKEVTEELGIVNSPVNSPMTVAWVDLNRDGALDLYAVEFLRDNRLFMNTPYPGRHYLLVELETTESNGGAVGAVVSLQAGHTAMLRMVDGGHGHGVQSPPLLHFGLGRQTEVDKLTVIWPSGKQTVLEKVPADQLLKVTEPGERKPAPSPSLNKEEKRESEPGRINEKKE